MTPERRAIWLDVDEMPAEAGWYATMHSWDADEGTFPSAHFFDGKGWGDDPFPITYRSRLIFPTKDAALDWAYAHTWD